MKRFAAFLLSIIMICVSCFWGIFDDVQEVQAAPDVSNYTDEQELTYITLLDLGLEDVVQSDKGITGQYEQGFGNTVVSFYANSTGPWAPRIHFGTNGGTDRTGINILLFGGDNFEIETLVVGNDGFDGSADKKIEYARTEVQASDFGLESFLGRKILYQIKTEYLALDADNVENDIRFTLYINKAEAISVDIKDQIEKLGNYIYFCDGIHALQTHRSLETSIEKTYDKMTLNDFGVADGSLSNVGDSTKDYGLTIDKTVFQAKMNFPNVGFGNLIWGGTDWFGINITNAEEGICITAVSKEASYPFYVYPEVADVALVQNSDLEFAISTEFFEVNTSEQKTKLRLGVWLNGDLYGGQYFLTGDMLLEDLTKHLHGKAIAAEVFGSSVEVTHPMPQELTAYTLADTAPVFTQTVQNVGEKDGTLPVDSFDKTLYSVNITYTHASQQLHYANDNTDTTVAGLYGGFSLYLEGDGCLYFGKLEGLLPNDIPRLQIEPNVAIGKETFLNEEFLLQISNEYVDADYDGNVDDVKLGLWFNGTLYQEQYLYYLDIVSLLGTRINTNEFYGPMVWSYYGEPSKSWEEYERWTYEDSAIENGIRPADWNWGYSAGASLHATRFEGNAYFTDSEQYILFGSAYGDYHGVGFQMKEGKLSLIYYDDGDVVVNQLAMEAEAFGLESLLNTTLKLELVVRELREDGERVLIEVIPIINGKLYEHKSGLFYVHKTALLQNVCTINLVQVESNAEILESRTLDETEYMAYTLSDAGIADGKGSAFGKLFDENGIEITHSGYDGLLFGSQVTFKTVGSRIHYATSAGDEFNGIQIRLQEDGSLILEDYSVGGTTREVLSYQAMVIEPSQFGYETFANQSIKLQLSTDVLARDTAEKNDVRLGIWIDGELANNTYCYILEQLTELGSSINFSQDTEVLRYSLWEIEKPSGAMENYIKLTGTSLYLVEAGTFTRVGGDDVYVTGDTVGVAGDYIATYETDGVFQAGTKSVILWKPYDTHADSVYNVCDLIAMKKAGHGVVLSTKAGQMAASQLKCSEECSVFRSYLVGSAVLGDDVKGIYYQTDEEGKVMPISGWVTPAAWLDFKVDAAGNVVEDYRQYGVETDFLQDKYYAMIQDLGINLLAYQEKNYAESNEMQILKGLSLAEKYGINFYVHDSGIADNETDKAVLAERIKAYSRYSSFAGIHVTDEPKTEYFNADRAGVKWISEIGNKTTLLNSYANLIGYANLSAGGDTEVYKQYVQEYIDTCHPTMLSFDSYPFANGGNIGFYLKSLDVIREEAMENNVPFAGCVGTSTSSYNTNPNTEVNETTQGQINWSVNTLLAYGAKGYTWFTLIQPRSFALVGDENGIAGMDFDRAGLIGADGSATPVYGMAKHVNTWVKRIDSILMDAKNVDILAVGNDAEAATGYDKNTYDNMTLSVGNKIDEILKVGVIAGVFEYDGKTVYYLVNHDVQKEQKVTLQFAKGADLTVYEQSNGNVMTVTDATMQELTLAAGAAALIIEE